MQKPRFTRQAGFTTEQEVLHQLVEVYTLPHTDSSILFRHGLRLFFAVVAAMRIAISFARTLRALSIVSITARCSAQAQGTLAAVISCLGRPDR